MASRCCWHWRATGRGLRHAARAGNGILTIARGTLPLMLLGPHGYGARQGAIVIPARIAQALAPWLFGLCIDRWGAGALWVSTTLCVFGFLALLSLKSEDSALSR